MKRNRKILYSKTISFFTYAFSYPWQPDGYTLSVIVALIREEVSTKW